MDWLAGVVFALFALARLSGTRYTVRAAPEYAADLTSWYRAWAGDSSNQPATAIELRQMLEAYRRGRRTARASSLPETKRAILEINDRQGLTVAAR